MHVDIFVKYILKCGVFRVTFWEEFAKVKASVKKINYIIIVSYQRVYIQLKEVQQRKISTQHGLILKFIIGRQYKVTIPAK